MSQPLNLLLKIAVFVTGLSAFFQVYSVQAILPLLVRDLHASEVQAGMAVGATVLGVALISPFIGMLSDAVGRKGLIIGSLLFLALPTALISGVTTIDQMLLYRFLQGLAIPGITVVLIAYVGEEFGGKAMTQLMSLYVSGTVSGGFLGRFLLGHLSELTGWRTAFYIMAAVCVACALFVANQLPASQNFVAKPHIGDALRTLKKHLHNRQLLAACALGACVLWSLVGCFTYINLYLADEPYRLNSGSLANIFSIYLIGMVITPLSARLISRFGSTKAVMVAVGLSMAGVAATLFSPLPAIVAALTIMSSGVFITQTATISYIAVNVKEGRSLASGLYYFGYYGGGTIGAWLCGLAYAQAGWQGVVWLLLVVQVCAILIAKLGMDK